MADQTGTKAACPMRKIPGYDGFVTVSTGISPTDYFLYRKGAKGEAVFVTDTPYHGDFRIDLGFAFVGSPATHLVTPEGLFLKIGGPACEQDPLPYPSECLAKDGALGTLSGGQSAVSRSALPEIRRYPKLSVLACFRNPIERRASAVRGGKLRAPLDLAALVGPEGFFAVGASTGA